jgi:predicted nucleic acid-binding protein
VSKIFIDTAPFIYLIEGNPHFEATVERYFDERLNEEDECISSVITYLEFCVVPLKENRTDVIEKFQELLLDMSLQLHTIDLLTAKKASELRGRYHFLKTADALQLACALVNSCDSFLTNDHQLTAVQELKILLLENV